jgi:hypothetical protein
MHFVGEVSDLATFEAGDLSHKIPSQKPDG